MVLTPLPLLFLMCSVVPGYSRCATYTGSVCRSIINHAIFASHFPSPDMIEQMIAPAAAAFVVIPTAYGCRDALLPLFCHRSFPRCRTNVVRNQFGLDVDIALPAFPTQSACQHATTACSAARADCFKHGGSAATCPDFLSMMQLNCSSQNFENGTLVLTCTACSFLFEGVTTQQQRLSMLVKIAAAYTSKHDTTIRIDNNSTGDASGLTLTRYEPKSFDALDTTSAEPAVRWFANSDEHIQRLLYAQGMTKIARPLFSSSFTKLPHYVSQWLYLQMVLLRIMWAKMSLIETINQSSYNILRLCANKQTTPANVARLVVKTKKDYGNTLKFDPNEVIKISLGFPRGVSTQFACRLTKVLFGTNKIAFSEDGAQIFFLKAFATIVVSSIYINLSPGIFFPCKASRNKRVSVLYVRPDTAFISSTFLSSSSSS